MILVDTNIWLRAEELDSELGNRCLDAIYELKAQNEVPAVCAQVIIEFWTVASRPREVNGLGMSQKEIQRNVQEILATSVMLPEPPDLFNRWMGFAQTYGPQGKRCNDLKLVAVANASGITQILTLNKSDFKGISEIIAIGPDEI